MEAIREYIPYLIPIILLQVGLLVFALIDLARRPKANGPKWLWVIIIVFINIIGPIAYFPVSYTHLTLPTSDLV